MRRTNIHLTEKQLTKLAKLAAKTGLPVAELIRRAIDAYLPPEGRSNERDRDR